MPRSPSSIPARPIWRPQEAIVVVAAGRPGMIGSEHIRPGAAVVDVGIITKPEGGLCGDVRADGGAIASALSPVPGRLGR